MFRGISKVHNFYSAICRRSLVVKYSLKHEIHYIIHKNFALTYEETPDVCMAKNNQLILPRKILFVCRIMRHLKVGIFCGKRVICYVKANGTNILRVITTMI